MPLGNGEELSSVLGFSSVWNSWSSTLPNFCIFQPKDLLFQFFSASSADRSVFRGCVRWSPEGYGHGEPGVCLGDCQTEVEGVASQGGRSDALLRRMPPYLAWPGQCWLSSVPESNMAAQNLPRFLYPRHSNWTFSINLRCWTRETRYCDVIIIWRHHDMALLFVTLARSDFSEQ